MSLLPSPARERRRTDAVPAGRGHPASGVLLLAGCAVALGLGAAVAVDPALALGIPAAGVLTLLVLARGDARIATVVFGGLVVFQSSTDVSMLKYGYLGLVLLSYAAALTRVCRAGSDELTILRPALLASAPLAALLAVSLPVALGDGVRLSDWFRDGFPYLLLVMVPALAFDASKTVRAAVLRRFLVLAGLLTTVSFTFTWLERRGVGVLDVTRIGAYSIGLIACLFSYAVVRAALGPGRVRWFAVVISLLVGVLVTGTRSGLVLGGAFAGVLGSAARCRVPLPRISAVLLPLAVAAALGTPWLASKVSSDPDFLKTRVSSAVAVASGGVEDDQSLLARRNDYQAAYTQVTRHVWLGTGPGYRYVRPSLTRRVVRESYTLDTPLTTVAKFGVVGTALCLCYLVSLGLAFRRSYRAAGPSHVATAGRALAAVFVVFLPFGSLLEDKGMAIGLLLLLALLPREAP
jgi:hypothetical protein